MELVRRGRAPVSGPLEPNPFTIGPVELRMDHATRSLSALALVGTLAACSGSTAGDPGATLSPAGEGSPIVQPGAPGERARAVTADELDAIVGVSHTEADVRFMQMMIPHHAQALDMTALVRQHATTDAVRQMALRMEISQRDEIELMSAWLRERDEPVEPPMQAMMGMPGTRMVDGVHLMEGMLTPAEMEELAAARGEAFDRLFLEGMIRHHQGAIDMVDRLFATSGAAQESTVFKFAEDVGADQMMEIERMQAVLETLR